MNLKQRKNEGILVQNFKTKFRLHEKLMWIDKIDVVMPKNKWKLMFAKIHKKKKQNKTRQNQNEYQFRYL